ncbi:MAG TPA: hypothetical protein VF493_14330 [Terriglobales bacterium]
MSTWLEAKIGSLGMAAGFIWSAYVATSNVTQLSSIFSNLVYTRGPLHCLGISALIWLHAKYRRSVAVNRA